MRLDEELAVELARHIAETRARTLNGELPQTIDEASKVFGIPKDEVNGYLNEVQILMKARELARRESIAAERSWTRSAWLWFFGGLAAGIMAFVPFLILGLTMRGEPEAQAASGAGGSNLFLTSNPDSNASIGPVPCEAVEPNP